MSLQRKTRIGLVGESETRFEQFLLPMLMLEQQVERCETKEELGPAWTLRLQVQMAEERLNLAPQPQRVPTMRQQLRKRSQREEDVTGSQWMPLNYRHHDLASFLPKTAGDACCSFSPLQPDKPCPRALSPFDLRGVGSVQQATGVQRQVAQQQQAMPQED